jgi:hypothetical protein
VLAPGVVGADLAARAAALRLAGALAARQQFMPDNVERAGAHHAAWTPLIAGARRASAPARDDGCRRA